MYNERSPLCQKFNQCHGQRAPSLQGESQQSLQNVECFHSFLLNEVEDDGYTLNHLFNADETGWWWRLMPYRSLIHRGEKTTKKYKNKNQKKGPLCLDVPMQLQPTFNLPTTVLHQML